VGEARTISRVPNGGRRQSIPSQRAGEAVRAGPELAVPPAGAPAVGCHEVIDAAGAHETLDRYAFRRRSGRCPWEHLPGTWIAGVQIGRKMLTFQWQDAEKVIVWPDELAPDKPRFPTPPWSQRQ